MDPQYLDLQDGRDDRSIREEAPMVRGLIDSLETDGLKFIRRLLHRAKRGNRIEKVVPSSVEVASTVPSCAVTISLTMNNPKPRPAVGTP
jgi:hypothetical protein